MSISTELLNLLNEMARMHQLAKQGDWTQFQSLEAGWLKRFQQQLKEASQLNDQEKKAILNSLLQQVEEIEQLTEQAMLELKQTHQKEQRQHKAIAQYLNL